MLYDYNSFQAITTQVVVFVSVLTAGQTSLHSSDSSRFPTSTGNEMKCFCLVL